MNGLNKIKTQRTCAKPLKVLQEEPINSEIISTRAKELLVIIVIFQPCFTEEIGKLSIIGWKDFANLLRDKFILGSPDLLEIPDEFFCL